MARVPTVRGGCVTVELMSSRVRSRAIVVLCLILVACAKQTRTERMVELRGQILAVRPNNEVLLNHGDIKGLVSIYDGSAWTPDQIAADMKRVLAR